MITSQGFAIQQRNKERNFILLFIKINNFFTKLKYFADHIQLFEQ